MLSWLNQTCYKQTKLVIAEIKFLYKTHTTTFKNKNKKSHNTNTLYPTIKPVDAMRARDKHTFQRFSIGDVTFFIATLRVRCLKRKIQTEQYHKHKTFRFKLPIRKKKLRILSSFWTDNCLKFQRVACYIENTMR